MKDFLGTELKVGDPVVFANVDNTGFEKGTVVSFTATRVSIKVDRGPGWADTISKRPNRVIIIPWVSLI